MQVILTEEGFPEVVLEFPWDGRRPDIVKYQENFYSFYRTSNSGVGTSYYYYKSVVFEYKDRNPSRWWDRLVQWFSVG